MSDDHEHLKWDPEPRLPAFIAILAVAVLNAALPVHLILGPRWLFTSIVLLLVIPTLISHWKNLNKMNRIFGFIVSGVDRRYDHVSCFVDLGPSNTRRNSGRTSPFGRGSVGNKHTGIFALVLASRRRWAVMAATHASDIPTEHFFSADDVAA